MNHEREIRPLLGHTIQFINQLRGHIIACKAVGPAMDWVTFKNGTEKILLAAIRDTGEIDIKGIGFENNNSKSKPLNL